MNRRKRRIGIAFLLLLVLICPPIWITYREYRQVKLDHALIAAIKEGNDRKALEALAEGASGEARDIGEPPTFREALLHLLENVQHRHRKQEQLPALVLLFQPKLPSPRIMKSGAIVRIGLVKYSTPDFKVVEALLDHGANANDQDMAGNSPLLYACWSNYTDTVSLLLKRGADPNLADTMENTPLMEASDSKTAGVLLEYGANLEAVNHYKVTALMFAVMKNNPSVVRLLLEHGARVIIKDQNGETALEDACTNPENIGTSENHQIIALLRQHGAK